MFIKGKSYIRREIHHQYGGQQQTGISTPADYPVILLFTGEQSEDFGYHDGWTRQGVFLYTGEGQRGDMDFSRGNRAIRDHIEDGKDLHLFEYIDSGVVRYVDKMICVGYEFRAARDIDNKLRKVIVFELQSLKAFELDEFDRDVLGPQFEDLSLGELRRLAVAAPKSPRPPQESSNLANYRNAAVRAYVLRRADGCCEACGTPAPFETGLGRPYLEAHYIRRISDGGPDYPDWVIGLCPNCHRRAHYGAGKGAFNQVLRDLVLEKEGELND